MGQAKQRRAAEIAYAKLAAQKFILPPTELEASWVHELSMLPVERARRPDGQKLKAQGMQPGHCHTNAAAYEARHPDALTMVSGWIIENDMFVFHSVVEEQGELICVTPSHDDEEYFDFVRDPKVVWEEGDTFMALRDGVEVPPILRSKPNNVIAAYSKFLARLDAGAPLQYALDLLQEEGG